MLCYKYSPNTNTNKLVKGRGRPKDEVAQDYALTKQASLLNSGPGPSLKSPNKKPHQSIALTKGKSNLLAGITE